jgi:hypothetical protein
VSFLPNSGRLTIDPQKLTYLLQANPGKAKFFAPYDFDLSRPQEPAVALHQHPVRNPYYRVTHTVHGVKYEIRCSMPTPDRRDPCVTTIWIIDAGRHAPRLVTGYAGRSAVGIRSRRRATRSISGPLLGCGGETTSCAGRPPSYVRRATSSI